jgi:hypothetical protein
MCDIYAVYLVIMYCVKYVALHLMQARTSLLVARQRELF